MQQALRPAVAGGIAIATASLVVAAPAVVPLADVHVPDIQLASGAEDITLDLVRHGQSTDNVNNILGTEPPGAHLTDLGEQQAEAVAPEIKAEFPAGIDGIYASELIRTQETAQPLANLLGMDIHVLPGLNELNAGILEGAPLNTFTELAYIAAPLLWILGDYLAPQLGSTVDPNGVAFDDRVSNAIDTIYGNSLADPDAADTDVAFSHAGTIAVWTLMNVKNPDFSVVLDELLKDHTPLSNTGQVVLDGNPTDGWTLVSYDGQDVPQTPDLFTGLFVDYRDLITAPQIALYHIVEAIQGGDQADITSALQTGFENVVAAITQFPQSVIDTLTGALSDGTGTAAADVAGEAVAGF